MLSISKDQIATLPTVEFDKRIILINNPVDCRKAVRYLRSCKVLGFDTETRPSFKKGRPFKVALLQISTHDECFLFRLQHTGFTDELIELFEDEKVLKVGLSIKDDVHQLSKLHDFVPANVLELQTFVKDYQIADNALQRVYAIIFGKRISKAQRLTNWEAEQLTEAQQRYASLDAYACLQIYDKLRSGEFDPASNPYQIIEPEPDQNTESTNTESN